ncbi:cytochrome P450 [Chaetomium sp. MPI-CAGE-AT-0009]|nr:cytochrome P450 [Chaetomium sp. MPI-CAGE-AT-0009]
MASATAESTGMWPDGVAGFLGQIRAANMTTAQCVGITTVVVLVSLLYRYGSPQIDPREPPVVKPGIPLVGHIVGLVRHGVDYFGVLRKSQPKSVAAATLPMLNGKVYVLWDTPMIQSAMRHKNLTFDVLGMEFAQRVFGLSDLAMSKLWGPDRDIETSAAGVTMQRIKGAMQGQHLYRMNVTALDYIANDLNKMDSDGLKIQNLYQWLQYFMTVATSEGLYGKNNPIRQDPSLIDALWEFEGNIQPLFLGILPKLIARKAYVNREKVMSALVPWYMSRKDEAPDVAEVLKVRCNTVREFGFPDEEVGRLEMALLFVATTNTIPTLYWFVTNVWLRPDLVEEIRRETLPLVKLSSREGEQRRLATLDISQLEGRAPLLVSCYRESIRLGNQSIGTRRVVHDTLLTDSAGNQHLFKAGVDVMWSVKAMHHSEDAWGQDPLEFDARRFTDQDKFDRLKKQSYVPFGGGKHLCPGRNFAFAENLGFVAALVVGFELQGLDEANVRLGASTIGEAVAKPPVDARGGAVVIKRRQGWEDVDWKFTC